jgi:4-hydroxybenzoate polyprenyltransferase
MIKDFLKLMRVHQWIKNFFVFAALIFSSSLFMVDKIELSIIGFLIFCAASSSIYIINDTMDIEADKKHPKKKFRPLASGKIKVWQALIVFSILIIIALFGSIYMNMNLFLVILIYIIMNLLYSKWLKHVVILDVIIIAVGYVLRVIAGAIIINVTISPWLLGMTLTLSTMIALGKRHSELVNQGTSKRKVLEKYDINFINTLLIFSSTITMIMYLLWCIENRVQTNEGALLASSGFIFYGITRYLYLTLKMKSGESPTRLVIKDKPMLINVLLWVIYMVFLIYF